ncbi:1-phosphofructokinase [Spiroplasma litorale]|uniref:1-phosphofructokinase n=1 Tax=Spiroplasma litorale TaxID=216942 RepID=A0A0K1W1G7_9MOLU|nr:1-phosphofructokinase family hexose kinase [Spiroplasma litorale]AKX34026.1 1-phosphofructokinase [Spiroplasma litorale]
MIYTITLNPAIDHIILVDKNINLGMTNYYSNDYDVIGGKGINAAIVLNNLEDNVEAIGILGKDNKDIFIKKFNEIGLKNNFFINEGSTRVNYKIKNLSINQETELNGMGFKTQESNLLNIKDYIKKNVSEKDIVIVTGSIAMGINDNIYKEIGEIVVNKKALLVCDCKNELLKNVLEVKPYIIKPNLEEICSTFNIEYKDNFSFDEIENLINKLKILGARNILLSMGSDGSMYFSEDNSVYKVGVAKGKLVNSVGAGDSMLAGFVYGINNNLDIENTLKYAASCGGATAFTEWLANKKEIIDLLEQISVTKIK